MKHFLALLVVCTWSAASFGQAAETKEAFINKVYKEFIDTSVSFYYLDKTANNIKAPDLSKHITGLIAGYAVEDLIAQVAVKGKEQTWNFTALPKARAVSKDAVTSITGRNIEKKASSIKDKQRRAQAIAKAQAALDDQPFSMRAVYHFSRPYFDKSGIYAIVAMSYDCGNLCKHGCTYLFQNEYGRWRRLEQFDCWTN